MAELETIVHPLVSADRERFLEDHVSVAPWLLNPRHTNLGPSMGQGHVGWSSAMQALSVL